MQVVRVSNSGATTIPQSSTIRSVNTEGGTNQLMQYRVIGQDGNYTVHEWCSTFTVLPSGSSLANLQSNGKRFCHQDYECADMSEASYTVRNNENFGVPEDRQYVAHDDRTARSELLEHQKK